MRGPDIRRVASRASAALWAASVGRCTDPLAGADEGPAASIRAARAGAVVRLTPVATAVNPLDARVVLTAFWDRSPRWFLAARSGLVAPLAAAAPRSWHEARRRPPPEAASPRALGRTAAPAAALAGAWGLAPAALFPGADPFGRFVPGCLAAGMITGGLGRAARGLRPHLALSLPAASGEPPLLAAAGMLFLYAAFISRNPAAHGALLAETPRGRCEIEGRREVLGPRPGRRAPRLPRLPRRGLRASHGHAAGDALPRRVAERLRAAARETDTTARPGGDEFAPVAHVLHQTPG